MAKRPRHIVPLMLADSKPGHEIESEMVVLVPGPLVSSTLLNLVLIPALYGRFGRPMPESARRQASAETLPAG